MRNFWKKRKEEVDEEFEDVDDLFPKNRKKRVKSPKPWGKKERLAIAFLLFSTIGVSLFLGFSARSWKLPGLPRLKLPNDFFEKKVILEKKKESNFDANTMMDKFQKMTSNLSGVYGFYVFDLEKGGATGVFSDEVFQAASLIKLPVMALMLTKSESKEISLSDKYILKDGDKIGGSGILISKPPGTEITYQQLVEYMGKYSDNTAFNIATGILGKKQIQDYIQEIGMRNTSLSENLTTPRDVGTFFVKLWQGRLLSQKSQTLILASLTDTSYEDWLVAGIPDNIRVVHKFGRELHVTNDAGIVFSDEPFVLVILSKGVVEKEADAIFPELSRFVYEGLSSFSGSQ